MRNLPRTRSRVLLAAFTLMGALAFVSNEAKAQNTYIDAPFNQGSVFYRPSGLQPVVRTRVVTAAPIYRPTAAVYAPGYAPYIAAAPAATVYVAPRAGRVYYPRGRVFGPRYWRGY